MKAIRQRLTRFITLLIALIAASVMYGIHPADATAENNETKTVTLVHSNSLNGYAFPCPT